mgnify:CR=1 FL=1
MTEEYKRQTNELFYNVTHRGSKVSEASLTELLAMQKGLEAFIKEKKQKEFEADVKELQEAFERFKAKYPSADWYVQVEQEGCFEEHDLFDLMDFTEIEP